MLSLLRRITKKVFTKYVQVVFVVLAFALMAVSSYYFIWETESKHLRKYAQDAILYTEANIRTDMLEPETLMGAIAEQIRIKIIHGETIKDINDYLILVNNYVWSSDEHRLRGVTGFYGVFDVFDGIMLIGIDTWEQPDNYEMQNRPWFSGAVNSAGEIYMTEPYLNVYSNQITITLSKRIFDNVGNPLGIICTNIELNRILSHVINTRFTEDGYGFLLSKNMILIAHPDNSLIGLSYEQISSGISAFKDEIVLKGSIHEATTSNYNGVKSIIFGQRLYNGWYIGLVTPRENYYKSTIEIAVIIFILGAIFATLLSSILLRISSDKEKSDERIRLMFEATPLAAIFWDKNFNVIDCNQTALNMFNIPSKHEYCRLFNDLSPKFQPDGRLSKDKAYYIFGKTIEEGMYTCEWQHQKLNGEQIPCELSCARICYKNDFMIVSYVHDLRIKKKVTAQLEQQSRLLDAVNTSAAILLANSNISMFESSLLKCFDLLGHCLDVDRVHIWQNETIEDEPRYVLKYQWLSDPEKDLDRFRINDTLPHGVMPHWQELFSYGSNIAGPVSALSQAEQDFLGSYKIKSIVLLPLFLENKLWGYFSLDDCRKERTFSEEEISILTSAGLMMSSAVNHNTQEIKMRETEERTQLMIDAAPLCAFFWDENLNLIDCNQEALKLFGVSTKQEFIDNFGSFSPEFQPDGEESAKKGGRFVWKAIEEGYSRFDWLHQNINGEQIPAEIICIRVTHKNQFNVVEYIRDLREQQAMLREMKKAEIAEESSKAKSNFLAKMSHEIRTPMNAILGIAEIQLQDISLSTVTKEAFERIYSSGDLLLGIINDILDLSKIEAGKLKLTPAQYDVASMIHDTVILCIMRYESKPVKFSLEVDENMPLLLISDELRIKQILTNILSNAFKYTDEGMVSLIVSTEQIDDKNNNIIFTISDTGQGMTEEQVNLLGSRYARFNMEANRKTEGTGLGMNITMNLIHLMNGSISIDSTPGMGSTFTVRLPHERINTDVIGKELAVNLMQLNHSSRSKIRTLHIKRDFMPYGRVLVVDDVETNLYVAKGLLAPYGLSIDIAISGFEAIEKIRDGTEYDVIFMDHMMPRMDGIEAAKHIRNMGFNNAIVALTANALTGQAEIFFNNGFDDFISKPIDIRQLNTVLNKLIRDKQPPETINEARKQQKKSYTSTLTGDNDSSGIFPEQIIGFFISDAKKAIKILESIYKNKCQREEDISLFIINVHAMKSALANIGETNLSNDAAALEQAGRDKNVKFIMAQMPDFIERLHSVVSKLKEKENNTAHEADSDTDLILLKEKLIKISAACAIYNKKDAKNIISELKKKSWSKAVSEWLSDISEYMLHSEFDTIVKVIDDYIKQI